VTLLHLRIEMDGKISHLAVSAMTGTGF